MTVDLKGLPVDFKRISLLSKKYNIPLILTMLNHLELYMITNLSARRLLPIPLAFCK